MRRLYSLSFLPLWLLFWAITLVLYGMAWRSGFERDFHGWFEMFYNQSFADCMNRRGMHITSLYQVTQLQLWLWSKLFGTHLLPWFLLTTGLYAAAGALLTDFFRKFYADFGWKNALPIAFWGGVFSLIAPHNAEIVIWKASYHYPVAVLLFSGIMLLVRRAVLTGSCKALAFAILLYALSTFTLELFYTTLPMVALLVFAYARQGNLTPARRKSVLFGLVAMMTLFLGHFLLYHGVYGSYIPHQQGSVEAFLKQPVKGFGHFLQNEFHVLLQGRYWPQQQRLQLYEAFGTRTSGLVSILLLALAVITSFFVARRHPRQAPVFWLVMAASTGMLLIITNWVPPTGLYYNDRYLYFAGLFQWQLVAVLLFGLDKMRATILGFLLAALLFVFTLYTALQLRRSAKVFWRVMEDFRWKDHAGRPVILLNVPANYKGIVMYQETPQASELNSHLRIYTGDSTHVPLHTVAGYNMEDTTDGARVLVESDTSLYVTLIRPGLWYWNGTLGASDHETNLYKMKLDEWSHQYRMVLKDTSALLLYFNRGRWHEVDKSKRDTEQE